MTSRGLGMAFLLVIGCTGDVKSPDEQPPGPVYPPGTGPLEGVEEGATVCGQVSVKLDGSQPPNVVLLVDQSGSMKQDFAGMSRWDAVYETLMDPTAGVVKQVEGGVRLGLSLYTSDDGTSNGKACPLLTEVPMAVNNFAAIDRVLSRANPVEDTPTAESITAITAKLVADKTPGPKVIVLATDGYPDTCAKPDPETDEARTLSVAAAKATFGNGVRIYVISVGDEVGDEHLQDMANAGAGLAVGGAEKAKFYKALNSAELVTAFGAVLSGIRSCSYDLNGRVDAAYINDGEVKLDGQVLRNGVDWRVLADGRTLELLGPSCEKVKTGGAHDVSAYFECEVIIE